MGKHRIHIEGKSSELNISDRLSGNHELPANFGSDEDVFDETLDTIPNMTVKLYWSDKEKLLEQVEEDHIREILGDATFLGALDGYSEYTIMGFYISKVFIGNHNLQIIIDNLHNKYVHLTLEWED